jgi:hypothetical protein
MKSCTSCLFSESLASPSREGDACLLVLNALHRTQFLYVEKCTVCIFVVVVLFANAFCVFLLVFMEDAGLPPLSAGADIVSVIQNSEVLIDFRDEGDFVSRHARNSTWIPWELRKERSPLVISLGRDTKKGKLISAHYVQVLSCLRGIALCPL